MQFKTYFCFSWKRLLRSTIFAVSEYLELPLDIPQLSPTVDGGLLSSTRLS